MEAGGDNKVNVDLVTDDPITNVDQPPTPSTKEEHGSTHNNHLEVQSHAADNNEYLIKSSSSLSEKPVPVPNDATVSNSLDETHSSTNNDHDVVVEPLKNQPSTCETIPTNIKSHDPIQEAEEGNQSASTTQLGTSSSPNLEPSNQEHVHASINATNSEETPNLEPSSYVIGESSNGDIPISSIPNHVSGQSSTPNSPSENIEHGPEIQNPQVQVMERPNESGAATSQYVFPSHVFARNNTNTPEWSTASNESLFSIYMGNMSFSSELACFKSCELDKPCDIHMYDQPNASPNHQPPLTPVNKFNDISQRTAELHEEGLKVTEAKAAETMREVIMESCLTKENDVKKEDTKSTSQHESDGSTKSYAFQT
ncbi:hypothetical protein TSUD_208050 [Trifolium subterraneum]|uniref:Uncharacterized protein n=1 Tax=Trifolium subterraneum TaxID=3900 RepID=A0A2Z6NJC1_TRISU|nr:hypothetical protein TSUD_208050 [Trifolium subterraneum]